jgi:hypothetical protein
MTALRSLSSLYRASEVRPGFACLETEICAETVSTLGQSGRTVESVLAELAAASEEDKPALIKAAADEVWAYFVQREMCGIYDHSPIISEMHIPQVVLNHLGMVTH